MILGEAPGADEDASGRQFTGKTGQLLRGALAEIGINADRDCVFTNSLICRPPDNATPNSKQVEWCRPNLMQALADYDVDVIIPLGSVAVESLIGWAWKSGTGGINRWAGFQIPCRSPNVWICPTYHPSYISREEKNAALRLWWGRHLRAAFELSGKPHTPPIPDLAAGVEIIRDPETAADIVRQMQTKGGPIAFDFETDRLKPDRDGAKLVTCAICYRGRRTIAYELRGAAVGATRDILRGDNIKLGANVKFEKRWAMAKLGLVVKNWRWDCMQAAHILDHRPGVTSVKFQSFVRFGVDSYNDHIEEFLSKSGPDGGNQILREIEIDDLLRYNGLDALLEYMIAKHQIEEAGYAPLMGVL